MLKSRAWLHGQFSANIATGTEFTVDKPDMYLSEKNLHESEDGAPNQAHPIRPTLTRREATLNEPHF